MLEIRPATSDDGPHLSQLFLLVRRQTFPWCSPDSFRLDDFYLETEGETVFVAQEDGCLALGFVSVWTPDSFVHHLFVAPGQQGRGTGSALLDSLESWLPRPYRLKCLVANSAAFSFYLNRGWKELDRAGCGLDEYAFMELA